MVFGFYLVTHGQVSPGGGFQGGVVLASVPLMLYCCGDYAHSFLTITSHGLAEWAEAAGAGVFVLLGLVPLFLGMPFLQNLLPLGKTGNVASSGTIALISLATGFEVGAGLVLVMMAFFERVLVIRESQPPEEAS